MQTMNVTRLEHELVPSFAAEGLYQSFSDILTPELLEEAGIPTSVLTDRETVVSLENHCKLLELAAAKTGDDFLGLHIGSEAKSGDMGALGYTILNSPTLRIALENFTRYLRVYARGCDMSLETKGGLAFFNFNYTIVEPNAIGRRQEAECTLALVNHLIELGLGCSWELKEVHFEHPRPEDISKHKYIFASPIYFGKSVNSLVFNKGLLDREIVQAETGLYKVLESHLSDVMSSQVEENDLLATVGNFIAKSLSNGVPNIGDVASQLCMTKRTLQRRLRVEGKLYNEVADEIRQQMAQQYVAQTKMPLTEIAFLLGYAHVSTFSRAFRRWTGLTPNECRRNA